MPEIKVYNNPIEGLRPSERGTEAALQVARRAGAFFNQAADATTTVGNQAARGYSSAIRDAGDVAVAFADNTQIRQGAPAFAGLTDALGKRWDDAVKSDPNNPLLAQQFREQVLEPELEKFKGSFWSEGAQKWANSHADGLRTHLYNKTAADMGTLAANAVSTSMRATISGLSNAAMRDPSSTDFLLKSVDSSVAGMVDSSPNLRGVQAETARTKLSEAAKDTIVKSAAMGAIAKASNPEAEAAKWGAKYPQYISGAELKQLEGNARQQIRADRQDAAYQDHMRKQQQQDRSDKTEVGYLQKLYSEKLEDQASVSTKAIVNDPNLTRVAKERMIGFVNREMKPETAARISNSTSIDLIDRIRAPDDDPRRISDLGPVYDAYTAGKLTKADFAFVRKEFSDLRTPEGQRLGQAKDQFLKAIGPSIDKSNPLMGKIDQDGKVNQYRLMVDLDVKMDEYRKAGKNPYDLINPSKPDFMGRPEALQPYMKPLQQSIQDQARRLTGSPTTVAPTASPPAAPPRAVEPRKPGETAEQYLKRTGH